MSHEDFARHYRVDASKMLDLAMHMPDHVEEAWRMMKIAQGRRRRGARRPSYSAGWGDRRSAGSCCST